MTRQDVSDNDRGLKIVLINPPAEKVRESHDLPGYPHSGLGYLAAYLNQKGIPADVIDAKLERLSGNDVIQRIEGRGYGLAGLTAMTHDIVNAAGLAAGIKKAIPGITTVIGGVHATALPQDTLSDFSSFDILVYGEGEITLYELVDCLQNRNSCTEIKGIAFRDGDTITINPPRPKIENLDELPFPDLAKYPECKEYHIITSRGCPFRCIFCMSPYGRDKIRERSPQNVISELKDIERHRPRLIKFNDETFGFNKARASELLDSIVANGLQHTKKVASLRVDIVTLPLLQKMKEAGFFYIDYGIESGNPDILKKIKKGITREQAEKAIRLTKDAGIRAGANFIIGHPGETMQTAMETVDFAVKLNADVNAIGLMVPYPGTEVARMAQKGEGGYKLLSFDWSDYNKQIGNALELETLSRRQMERLQLKAYLKILTGNRRYYDLVKFFLINRRSGAAFLKKMIAGRRKKD